MERNDLIERLRECDQPLINQPLPFSQVRQLIRDAASTLEADATTIASLSEALAEAEKKGASAEAIIGKLQSLITNVEYWVAHGCSETATKAMADARKDGWSEIGWRQHRQAHHAPPRDLSQGGQHG